MKKYISVLLLILISIILIKLKLKLKSSPGIKQSIIKEHCLKVINIDMESSKFGKFKPYNTSILKNPDNSSYTLIVRISNYTMCEDNNVLSNVIKNLKNYVTFVTVDENFNFMKKNVYFFDKIKNKNARGIEDLRGFYYNNKLYFIGTFLENNNNIFTNTYVPFKYNYSLTHRPRIGIINDEGDIIVVKSKDIQKNWAPIILSNKIYFITHHNPFKLATINLDTQSSSVGEFNYIYTSNFNTKLPKLRGNTPYIDIGNGKYLGITHTRIQGKDYAHYFTLIEYDGSDFKIKISKPICLLGNCGIEFVMGFISDIRNENYIITFGKNDCSAHITIIPKNIVHSYLNI